jgi:hypothetical protein
MNRDEIVRAAYAVALQNPYRHQRDEEPPLPTEIDHHGTRASWIPSRPTRKSAWTNPTFGSVNSLVELRHNSFDHREGLSVRPCGASLLTSLSRSDRALLTAATRDLRDAPKVLRPWSSRCAA